MAEEKLKALLRSCLDKILLQIQSVSEPSSEISVYELLGATACGAASFPLCLGIFQTTIFRPVRLTCNRNLAQVFGCLSVALSSSISTVVFLLYPQLVRNLPDRQRFSLKENCCNNLPKLREEIGCSFTGSHIPLFVGSNVIVFKALGGRFRSVLPSSLLHPGAFARTSFPASSHNYASSFIKQKLLVEGKRTGCHSCGRRWSKLFVGDHMPPNKLVKSGQKQRFYPQCKPCSYQQGATLSKSSKKLAVKTHGTSLRVYHTAWLPSPFVVMMATRFTTTNSANCLKVPNSENDKDLCCKKV